VHFGLKKGFLALSANAGTSIVPHRFVSFVRVFQLFIFLLSTLSSFLASLRVYNTCEMESYL